MAKQSTKAVRRIPTPVNECHGDLTTPAPKLPRAEPSLRIEGGVRLSRMRLLHKLTGISWGLAMLGGFALADPCSVSELPNPTGPFVTGSTTLPSEAFASSTKPSRLQVQLWYPAKKSARGSAAPYISDSMLKYHREECYGDFLPTNRQ
jgi:hypothetical protein